MKILLRFDKVTADYKAVPFFRIRCSFVESTPRALIGSHLRGQPLSAGVKPPELPDNYSPGSSGIGMGRNGINMRE